MSVGSYQCFCHSPVMGSALKVLSVHLFMDMMLKVSNGQTEGVLHKYTNVPDMSDQCL
jgi:hypothetical protein